MADWQDKRPQSQAQPGLVATFMVFVIILLFTGLVLSQSNSDETAGQAPLLATATPTTAVPALAAVDHTNTPSPQPSPTLKPTSTTTFTPTPTHTPTDTPSPLPTETATATVTAVNNENGLKPPQLPTQTAPPAPLPTPNGVLSSTVKVPILMYHYIGIPPEDADKYRIDLSVAPENFRAQMQYLAQNGYTTISLYDLSLAITDKIPLPEKPVIITLDDGYRDNYENAFSILKEFNHSATIFLATDFLDKNNPAYLSWDMVHEMAAYGIYFEPHTKSHIDLREQDRNHLIWEMLGSQQTVAAHIGYTPRYFAYPGGTYDEDAIAVLHELGFWGAVTTRDGSWHNFEERFQWTRVRVHDYTTMAEFADLVDLEGTVGGILP